MDDRKPRVVRTHDVHLDSEYISWIQDVKRRFRNTQIKASVKVNSEQLLFNWNLGRDLVIRKAEETWGSGIVEQVSMDLQDEFPSAQGFSTTNLWYMKKWYLFYEDMGEKLQQLVGELETSVRNSELRLLQTGTAVGEKLQQPVGEIPFPAIFGYVPWGHHIMIITKCKSPEEAVFYLKETITEGLSRNALRDSIEFGHFQHAGRVDSNYEERLPVEQGKMAQEIIKDSYDFGFITLPKGYKETVLEDALEKNITRFLLELGTGFSFVGRQKEIIVSGKTRKIDMLFYHIRLRCYVVVDLKVKPFEPEFAGKINFYVNAVNDLMKSPDDNPTIGLLICKEKDRAEVQWALGSIQNPIGVATYGNITEKEVRALLPSEEDIQACIARTEEEFRLLQQSENQDK